MRQYVIETDDMQQAIERSLARGGLELSKTENLPFNVGRRPVLTLAKALLEDRGFLNLITQAKKDN